MRLHNPAELVVGNLVALGLVIVLKLVLQREPLYLELLLQALHQVAESIRVAHLRVHFLQRELLHVALGGLGVGKVDCLSGVLLQHLCLRDFVHEAVLADLGGV